MRNDNVIQLFEDKKIRMAWDEGTEEGCFTIVDIVGVLTKSENPQVYWRVLKNRLLAEGHQRFMVRCILRTRLWRCARFLLHNGKQRENNAWEDDGK